MTLTSPEAFGLFAGLPVRSGVTVTSATALRVPAVAAAVGMIAEACGIHADLHDREVLSQIVQNYIRTSACMPDFALKAVGFMRVWNLRGTVEPRRSPLVTVIEAGSSQGS
ncbi:hypothetical protein QWZ10_08110 [Paracoccus cavernae]|uniref:Uncharacterized protein n=1 Tax=Paracoccus cavernae TaxID=1571207 RepID=A0ABT8D4X4_9RHOB|nr:hypothetical protein [Paracoccus cavernae]